MKKILVLMLFSLIVLYGESQIFNLNGVISIQNSKYHHGAFEFVEGAHVTAPYAVPAISDGNGWATLTFVGVDHETQVNLKVEHPLFEIANRKEIQTAIIGQKVPFQITMAPKGSVAKEEGIILNRLKEGIIESRDSIFNLLQSGEIFEEAIIANLNSTFGRNISKADSAKKFLNRLSSLIQNRLGSIAYELASMNLDWELPLYQQANRHLRNGAISAAINILDNSVLEEQFQKGILLMSQNRSQKHFDRQSIQNARLFLLQIVHCYKLKAIVLELKFDFIEARASFLKAIKILEILSELYLEMPSAAKAQNTMAMRGEDDKGYMGFESIRQMDHNFFGALIPMINHGVLLYHPKMDENDFFDAHLLDNDNLLEYLKSNEGGAKFEKKQPSDSIIRSENDGFEENIAPTKAQEIPFKRLGQKGIQKSIDSTFQQEVMRIEESEHYTEGLEEHWIQAKELWQIRRNIAELYHDYSTILFESNKLPEALTYAQKSLNILQSLDGIVYSEIEAQKIQLGVISIQLGYHYKSKQNFKLALSNFQLALKSGLEFGDLYYEIGKCKLEIGKYQDALASFHLARCLDSALTKACISEIGVYHAKHGDFSNARSCFNELELLNEDEILPLLDWAIFYAIKKKQRKALANLQKAIRYGFTDLNWIKTESAFDNLRDHPIYIKLIQSLEQQQQQQQ